jgi:hypothetical protein
MVRLAFELPVMSAAFVGPADAPRHWPTTSPHPTRPRVQDRHHHAAHAASGHGLQAARSESHLNPIAASPANLEFRQVAYLLTSRWVAEVRSHYALPSARFPGRVGSAAVIRPVAASPRLRAQSSVGKPLSRHLPHRRVDRLCAQGIAREARRLHVAYASVESSPPVV